MRWMNKWMNEIIEWDNFYGGERKGCKVTWRQFNVMNVESRNIDFRAPYYFFKIKKIKKSGAKKIL